MALATVIPLRQVHAPDPRVLAAVEEAKELAMQVLVLKQQWAWLDEEITVDAGDDSEADERRQATGLEDLRHAMVAIEFAADWEPS